MTTSTGSGGKIHRRVEMIMGMPISLALRGRHAETSQADIAWHQVVSQLRDVDRIFSTYRPDSMISRLGRGEIDLDDCPPEVAEVIAIGADATRRSDGAFSIMLPGPEGTRLDPSGVVKGWAVERAARILEQLPDTDFCLSAGGDMVCRVATVESPGWRVGIEAPDDPSVLIGIVPIMNACVATSGTTHRGEHIVDARTGEVPGGIASVTVIADSLTRADVDATSAYALGVGAVDWLSQQAGLLGLVVKPDRSCITVDNRTGTPRVIRHPHRQHDRPSH
jgi:FAD:protein FMN transferase